MNLVEIYTTRKNKAFLAIMDSLIKSDDPYATLAMMLELSNQGLISNNCLDKNSKLFNAMYRGIFS